MFLCTRLHMLSTLKRFSEEGEEEDDKSREKVNRVSVSFYYGKPNVAIFNSSNFIFNFVFCIQLCV